MALVQGSSASGQHAAAAICISPQASLSMVGASQKKWLILCEAQNGRVIVIGVRRKLSKAPPNQELAKIIQQTRWLMRTG